MDQLHTDGTRRRATLEPLQPQEDNGDEQRHQKDDHSQQLLVEQTSTRHARLATMLPYSSS
jgi:hypothetical protein